MNIVPLFILFWCAPLLLVDLGIFCCIVIFIIMDSGVPLAPSFNSTSPTTFSHFILMNLSMFHNGMNNYDTRSMPWVSNNFPLDMPKIPSPFPSSPSPSYMNPSFGSGGKMALLSTSSFDMNHIPQSTLIVGGLNIPYYGSNHVITLNFTIHAYLTSFPLAIFAKPSLSNSS